MRMKKESQTRRQFLEAVGIASSSVTLSSTILGSGLAAPERPNAPMVKLPPNYAELRPYTGLLRLYDEFDFTPAKQAPKFQYDHSHPELHRLRDAYKLDQIAGTGDEFSKALMVIRWIKEHVGYKPDITSAVPEVARTLPMNA